jgi:hypothetical protein
MAKRKSSDSLDNLLKKGDYICTNIYGGDELLIILGLVEGTAKGMARVKGYEIIPKGLVKFRIDMLQFTGGSEHFDGFDILTDDVDYRQFHGIVPIDKKVKIIDKESYDLTRDWMEEGLPKLFSEYRFIKEGNVEEMKKFLSATEEKLRTVKSESMKGLLTAMRDGIKSDLSELESKKKGMCIV